MEDVVRIPAGSECVPMVGFVILSPTLVSPKLCDVRDSRFDIPRTRGPLSAVPMFCSTELEVAGRTDACRSICCITGNVLLSYRDCGVSTRQREGGCGWCSPAGAILAVRVDSVSRTHSVRLADRALALH